MQVINIVITKFNIVRKKTKLLQLTLRLRQKIGANLLTLSSVGRPTFWWEKPQGTMRFRNSLTMHKRSKQKLTKFMKVNNGWHFCCLVCIIKLSSAVVTGSLKSLQEHLDRRKFCMARDKGTNINILQKAILFGHQTIQRLVQWSF